MPQGQALPIVLQQQLVGTGKSVGQGVAHGQRVVAEDEPAAPLGPVEGGLGTGEVLVPGSRVDKGGSVIVLDTGNTDVPGVWLPCWAPSICW